MPTVLRVTVFAMPWHTSLNPKWAALIATLTMSLPIWAQTPGIRLIPICSTTGTAEENQYTVAMAQKLWEEIKKDSRYDVRPLEGIKASDCASYGGDFTKFLNSLTLGQTIVVVGPYDKNELASQPRGWFKLRVVRDYRAADGDMSWLDFTIGPPTAAPSLSAEDVTRVKGGIEHFLDQTPHGTLFVGTPPRVKGAQPATKQPDYKSEETLLWTLDAEVLAPAFSRDVRHMAYGTRTRRPGTTYVGSKPCVVVDGKADKEYDNLISGSMVFSPDGTRLA